MLCVLVFLCAVVNVLEDSLQGGFLIPQCGSQGSDSGRGLGGRRAFLLKHLTFCCMLSPGCILSRCLRCDSTVEHDRSSCYSFQFSLPAEKQAPDPDLG